MFFENTTRLPAQLSRTVVDDERMLASVVARATYAIGGDHLELADVQPWRVSSTAWEPALTAVPLAPHKTHPFRGVETRVQSDRGRDFGG
jgi:hypothetical protein